MSGSRSNARLWRIAGHLLPIGTRTLIMVVLNVKPDSFGDDAQLLSPDKAVDHVQMLAEGADIMAT